MTISKIQVVCMLFKDPKCNHPIPDLSYVVTYSASLIVQGFIYLLQPPHRCKQFQSDPVHIREESPSKSRFLPSCCVRNRD